MFAMLDDPMTTVELCWSCFRAPLSTLAASTFEILEQPDKHISNLGFPKIRGTFFGCPYNKDYSILGSILGYPNFGKLPF